MTGTDEFGARLRAAATDMPDNPFRAEQLLELDGRLRRRRRQNGLVAGAAVLPVAALGLVFALGGRHSGGGATVPAATTTPDESRRIGLGRVSFVPPAGWAVQSTTTPWLTGPDVAVAPDARQICLLPVAQVEHPDEATAANDCGGGILVQYGTIAGAEGQRFKAHQPAGWVHGTGTSICPVNPTRDMTDWMAPSSTPADAAPVTSDDWRAGRLVGVYDRWAAHCVNSEFTFFPESWYLPEIPFQVLDYLGHTDETAELLASLRIE